MRSVATILGVRRRLLQFEPTSSVPETDGSGSYTSSARDHIALEHVRAPNASSTEAASDTPTPNDEALLEPVEVSVVKSFVAADIGDLENHEK